MTTGSDAAAVSGAQVMEADLAAGPVTLRLPGTEVEVSCNVQALSDEDYAYALEVLATTRSDDVPAPQPIATLPKSVPDLPRYTAETDEPAAAPVDPIDSAVQRLPNVLTLHAGAGILVLLTAAAAAGEPGSLSRAVAVAAAAGALFTATALGGMGLGDAKLAVSLGALLGWHSWQAALAALVTSYFLGAVVTIGLILTGRQHRKSHLAFGPFLIIGTLATLVTSM
ncbi:prepilin peptidase [Streptomyces sioyaensis]|uniref:prepilin peptidase n=1 Tax=Streptomyces sioyaensis TaxID=67364 RepID=UPI0036E1CBEC